MNSPSLIRSAMAALAATALLTAQSAPATRARASGEKAKAEATASDRLQIRLAEVIAMLEEDDLTPEQRSQAKQKLEEISTKLRAAAKSGTSNVVALSPSTTEMRVRSVATTPVTATTETTFGEIVEVAPTKVRNYSATVESGSEPIAVVVETEPQDPKPAKAPKPPKAPKAPKAPEAESGDEPAEGQTKMRFRYVNPQGGEAEIIEVPVERRASTKEWETRVKADASKAALDKWRTEAGAEARMYRVKAGELRAAAEKYKAENELAPKTRYRAIDVDDLKAAEEDVTRARRAYVLDRTKNDAEAEAEAIKTYSLRARKAQSEAATKDAQAQNKLLQLRRSRAGERAADDDDDGDDDAEIRALVEEMRAEMKEIRSLLQELRKQAQSSRTRTPRAGGGQDAFAPATGGVAAGRQARSAMRSQTPAAGASGLGGGMGEGFGGMSGGLRSPANSSSFGAQAPTAPGAQGGSGSFAPRRAARTGGSSSGSSGGSSNSPK
jgi:hypothetical protein